MVKSYLEVDTMKVITGYLYHIKDEFFDRVNDKRLIMKMVKQDLHTLRLKMEISYGLFL